MMKPDQYATKPIFSATNKAWAERQTKAGVKLIEAVSGGSYADFGGVFKGCKCMIPAGWQKMTNGKFTPVTKSAPASAKAAGDGGAGNSSQVPAADDNALLAAIQMKIDGIKDETSGAIIFNEDEIPRKNLKAWARLLKIEFKETTPVKEIQEAVFAKVTTGQ